MLRRINLDDCEMNWCLQFVGEEKVERLLKGGGGIGSSRMGLYSTTYYVLILASSFPCSGNLPH